MIKAEFKSYGSYTTDSVSQWDLNQKLTISGLDINVAPVLAFSCFGMYESIIVQSKRSNGVITCDVPNAILQFGKNLNVDLCSETGGQYKAFEKMIIPVNRRKKPSDYLFTNNVSLSTYESIKADLEEDINSNKTYMDKVKTELKNDNKILNGRIDTILTGAVNTTKLVTVHSATIRNNSASDLTFKISSKDNETLKSIKDKSPTVINANVIAKALDGVAINGKGIPSSYNVESTNDEYVITVYSGSSSVVGQYVFMAVVTIAYEDTATDINSAELKDIRTGANGTTYPTAGDAVREQINDLKKELDDSNLDENVSQIQKNMTDISQLKESLLSVGDASINLYIGLSEVLNVFKNTVFKTANTGAFKTLESSIEDMKPEGLISLTYHMTNCKISNQKPYLIEGTPYVGTVTIYDNTEFEYITVKMGGVDVTSSVLSGMEIKIPKVTGDIEITASSRSLYLADGISQMNYIMSDGNGDAYVNTDWVMSNISEKMEIGVILPETSEYSADNNDHPFFGVNADSALSSSVYSAIELGCTKIPANDTKVDYVARFRLGWFKYQTTVSLGGGYYDRDLQKYSTEPHYISLVNGSQNVWTDENMTTLFNPTLSIPTTKETGTESKIPPFPLWLFRSNIQDVAYDSSKKKNLRCPKVKITCFKVWDADGSLVVNMRPAKREKDNVFGFYDTVRKRFFTNEATTGSLVGA